MRTNAILLIDLENFFLGREENINSTPAPHIYSFKEDLERLYNFAVDLAGERRLVVRRAYANFNVWRMTKEGGPKEYYLQQLPNLLMDKGIEPVQVFRFPGGGNKNASDMRLAMDATALLNDQAGVDLFLLVTGDADFIPLVLELKRRAPRSRSSASCGTPSRSSSATATALNTLRTWWRRRRSRPTAPPTWPRCATPCKRCWRGRSRSSSRPSSRCWAGRSTAPSTRRASTAWTPAISCAATAPNSASRSARANTTGKSRCRRRAGRPARSPPP